MLVAPLSSHEDPQAGSSTYNLAAKSDRLEFQQIVRHSALEPMLRYLAFFCGPFPIFAASPSMFAQEKTPHRFDLTKANIGSKKVRPQIPVVQRAAQNTSLETLKASVAAIKDEKLGSTGTSDLQRRGIKNELANSLQSPSSRQYSLLVVGAGTTRAG